MRTFRGATGAAALVLMSAIALFSGGCGPRHAVVESRTTVGVGEGTVDVVVHEADAPGLTYVNLHDDENTSVKAALELIKFHGGRIVEIQHGGERNVTFPLEDSVYAFDPNRIFTDEGIRATLSRYGPYSDTAHAVVRAFADTLRSIYGLDRLPAVVTLHNNTEDEYSALSYAAGGEYEQDAAETAIPPGADPDDFFFVTDARLFGLLRDAGFVVVLQDNAQATDDGSLSVYCGRHGVPYVNVEAQHGHRRAQTRMLDAVRAMIEVRS